MCSMLRARHLLLGIFLLLAACDKGPKAPSPPKPPIKATTSAQTPAAGFDDANPNVAEDSTDEETDSDSEPDWEAYEVDDTDTACDSDGTGDGDG
jgi:hypothetical protein